MDDKQLIHFNSKEQWNDRFLSKGPWDKKNGRTQTRVFAEFFNRKVTIPLKLFSLLDVGCALGDALPVFKNKYPDAQLSGCDFSSVAIERCKEEFGSVASFFASSIEQINGKWDIIYCSNTIEHFENPQEIAGILLKKCTILYIMVPFEQMNRGLFLTKGVVNYDGHLCSFFTNSFDELIAKGSALKINYFTGDCPPAWGLTFFKKTLHVLGTIRPGRKFSNMFRFPKQIIYEIYSK